LVRIENSTSGINGLPRRPFVRNACDYYWRNIKGRERKAMSFEYVSVEEAIKGRGLRMVVVGEVPSPWGEAAKGFLHIKGVNWVAVRLAYDSEPLRQWAGQRSGPVAVYENERPRSGVHSRRQCR
jgi:hypothetical protein